MRNVLFFLTISLFFRLLFSCTTSHNDEYIGESLVNSKLLQSITKVKGKLKKIDLPIPNFIIEFHKSSIQKEIDKGEYYLLTSKKVDYFKVIEFTNYEANLGWSVFLIKGELKTSEDELIEYDFYGIYKGSEVFSFDYLAQPVEIVTELETYIVTDSTIYVYGRQWDLSGINDDTKPPKDQQMLICFP